MADAPVNKTSEQLQRDAANIDTGDSGGAGGFLKNNKGLVFGGVIAVLAMFSGQGGIMPWLFALGALIAGFATDNGNDKSLIGKASNLFTGKKDDAPGGVHLSAGRGAVVPQAAVEGKITAPNKDNEQVIFTIDKDGKLTEAKEGQGLLTIVASYDKDKNIVVNYVASTNEAGKFPYDNKKALIVTEVNQKITLPVKDGRIDVDAPAFKENIIKLREIAEGQKPAGVEQAEAARVEAARVEAARVEAARVAEQTKLAEAARVAANRIKIPENDTVIFGVDKNGNKTDKLALDTFRVRVSSDAAKDKVAVVDVSIVGADGKNKSTKVPSNITLPLKDGVLDLNIPEAKETLAKVRRYAEPEKNDIVVITPNSKLVQFAVNKDNKLVDRMEEGVMKIIAKSDGTVIGINMMGKDGMPISDASGNPVVVPPPTGRVHFSVNEGYIDLTNIGMTQRLDFLRKEGEKATKEVGQRTAFISSEELLASLGNVKLVNNLPYITDKPNQIT